MIDIKPSNSLRSSIKNDAPSKTLSENYGRSSGYDGDSDEYHAGYSAALIYVQTGLSEFEELFREVAKLVFFAQSGYRKKYPIVVAAYGNGSDFIHDKKYFDMGYLSDRFSDTKIMEVLKNLSGTDKSDIPAVIPDFFPKTDNRSLYSGKTRFEKDDLMVIIGKKEEVFFADHLQEKFSYSVKKRILFVEIDGDNVNWNYKNFDKFFNKMELDHVEIL
ncbi:MAG: hypothetical protein NT007_00515 [Candidatus Kapabacteria bacterium]|nr:hypothetical protein [Candidatus Kapabacteria bacterium]